MCAFKLNTSEKINKYFGIEGLVPAVRDFKIQTSIFLTMLQTDYDKPHKLVQAKSERVQEREL